MTQHCLPSLLLLSSAGQFSYTRQEQQAGRSGSKEKEDDDAYICIGKRVNEEERERERESGYEPVFSFTCIICRN